MSETYIDNRIIDESRERTNHEKRSRDRSSETNEPHTDDWITDGSRERTNHGEASKDGSS